MTSRSIGEVEDSNLSSWGLQKTCPENGGHVLGPSSQVQGVYGIHGFVQRVEEVKGFVIPSTSLRQVCYLKRELRINTAA